MNKSITFIFTFITAFLIFAFAWETDDITMKVLGFFFAGWWGLLSLAGIARK